MIVLERFSRTRLNVIERLLKKKKKAKRKKQEYIYIKRKLGYYSILTNVFYCSSPVFVVPRQTFPIVRARGKGNLRKRNAYSTARKHYRNVTDESNIFRTEDGKKDLAKDLWLNKIAR